MGALLRFDPVRVPATERPGVRRSHGLTRVRPRFFHRFEGRAGVEAMLEVLAGIAARGEATAASVTVVVTGSDGRTVHHAWIAADRMRAAAVLRLRAVILRVGGRIPGETLARILAQTPGPMVLLGGAPGDVLARLRLDAPGPTRPESS
jgi:hypothetical protein